MLFKRPEKIFEKFHRAESTDWFIETSPGVRTVKVMRPLERVGLYIPGGKTI